MIPITEHNLTVECESIVKDAIWNYTQYGHGDITEFVDEYIHETVDGHQWVIYYHKAHELCQNVETDRGEDYVHDMGITPKTYNEFATLIAYGEMVTRCREMMDDMIEAYEERNDEEEAATA